MVAFIEKYKKHKRSLCYQTKQRRCPQPSSLKCRERRLDTQKLCCPPQQHTNRHGLEIAQRLESPYVFEPELGPPTSQLTRLGNTDIHYLFLSRLGGLIPCSESNKNPHLTKRALWRPDQKHQRQAPSPPQ